MGLSSFILKIIAKDFFKKNQIEKYRAIENQKRLYNKIIARGSGSLFGKNNGVNRSINYNMFTGRVPVSSYEDYHKYISLISHGGQNILTKKSPK